MVASPGRCNGRRATIEELGVPTPTRLLRDRRSLFNSGAGIREDPQGYVFRVNRRSDSAEGISQ